MNKHNIDHGVMLCLSQLYCNGWGKKDCFDAIRFQNDFNASVQSDYPDKVYLRICCTAIIYRSCSKEIDRCVNELGLKLLCLPTHFLNSNGEWFLLLKQMLTQYLN